MSKQMWGYTFRKIDGKLFRVGTWHTSKSDANVAAQRLMRKGYQVRILPRRYKGKLYRVVYAHPDPLKR